MTDKNEGTPQNQNDNAPVNDDSKVADLQKKLDDQNAATKRLADSKAAIEAQLVETQNRIAELEKANEAPKEDSQRLQELEIKLAKSEAVAQYGLSREDADALVGTPEQIVKQAEYWSSRVSKQGANDQNEGGDPPKGEDPPADPPADPPVPKKREKTNWDRFKSASKVERAQMIEDAKAGRLDLSKGYKGS